VQLKSQNPFRLVASLNSNVEPGVVKVVNRFQQNGESPMKFEIIKPPKGAEASMTLVYLVIGIVALVVIAVVIVALRSRKARVPAGQAAAAPSVPPPAADSAAAAKPAAAAPASPAVGGAPKTMAISKLNRVWVARADGSTNELEQGTNLIGREPHCKVKVEITGVSREHAKIDADFLTGAVFVEDLGSTNGTYWGPEGTGENDLQRLSQRKLLANGDTVWIGGEKLSVFFESASAGAPQEG
jgi:hypothetical protein